MIEASNLITGEMVRFQEVDVLTGDEDDIFNIEEAGSDTKRRLLVLEMTDGVEYRLVEKEMGISDSATEYWNIWWSLKKAGLPVVDLMWFVDEERVLMMDLRCDGCKLYGNSEGIRWEKLRKFEELDKVFIEVPLEAVREKVYLLASYATELGIELPWDDCFELVVNKDGSWEILILDLSNVRFREECVDLRRSGFLLKENKDHVEDTLKRLQVLQQRMSMKRT